MSWTWLLYLTSGVVATVVTAHLMTRKSRQSPPPLEEKPVPATTTTNVEINVNIHPSLCHSWCPFCDASAEDLEQSQKLEDLARRLAALYDASNAEEDAAEAEAEAEVDRHLAFARYLVQSGRLKEDL